MYQSSGARPGQAMISRIASTDARDCVANRADLTVPLSGGSEEERRRRDAEIVQVGASPGERLEIREGEPEPMADLVAPVRRL